MGSSSGEEFGWTNTSNDDSDTEPEMTYDVESESGKTYKKKLQKELFQNGNHEAGSAEETTPRKKLKKPKLEAASGSSSPSPRRVKRESLADGLDDAAAAERILHSKIKQERLGLAAPPARSPPRSSRKRRASSDERGADPEMPRKKKKKRDKDRSEHDSSATDAVEGAVVLAVDGSAEPSPAEIVNGSTDSPRKKKKNRKSEREIPKDESYYEGWWKFEAEETVVQPRPEPKKRVEEHKPFTSKEFVSDDSSSEDERSATVAPPAPRASAAERITFEEESQSDSAHKQSRKNSYASTESPRRDRLESPRRDRLESPQKARLSERITFENEPQVESECKQRRKQSQVSTEVPRRARISERITFEEDSQSAPEPPAPTQTVPARKSLPAPDRPRISDRITFEEAPAAGPRPSGARLGRFLRAHAHMLPVLGAFPAGAALTADDDVWLLRCPRDLPPAALRGVTLDLAFRGRLKVGGRAYEATPGAGAERAAVLAPAARGGYCVRALPVRGLLRLRARPPRPRAAAPEPAAPPERVPLPATRPRHPLLGADLARAELPPAVRRRLAAAAARAAPDEPDGAREPRREKKKKKKKHKERVEPEPEPEPEPSPEPEPAEQKKRKRKHSSRHDAEAREPERDAGSPPRKKKAKKDKERRRDDAALWDSERAIEESLFNF